MAGSRIIRARPSLCYARPAQLSCPLSRRVFLWHFYHSSSFDLAGSLPRYMYHQYATKGETLRSTHLLSPKVSLVMSKEFYIIF